MVGRGAFRFGRSSPPRFPARTEGVGSRLRCLAESRETTAEGPPGSDGRRWTAAVATRKAGMGFALKYQYPRSIGGRGARVGCRTDLFFDAAAGHVAAGDPHGGLRRATSQVQERGACGHRALARCAMARCHTRPLATGVTIHLTESGGKSRQSPGPARGLASCYNSRPFSDLFARNRGLGCARGTSNSALGS